MYIVTIFNAPIGRTKGGLIIVVADKSGNVRYMVDRRAATINCDCTNSACAALLNIQSSSFLIGRTLEEHFWSFVAVTKTFISNIVHIYTV